MDDIERKLFNDDQERKIPRYSVHDKIEYRLDEPRLMAELQQYIDNTYSGHYGKNKRQAIEEIIDAGLGAGFCLGNIKKYSGRYGKKKGTDRDDLWKIVHYGLIMLHIHDRENRR